MTAYLIVTGGLFLIVGLRALFKPVDAVAVPFSLNPEGVDAMNYLRSGTGGVTIASGAVMLAGALLLPSLAFAGLMIAVTVLGGLLFGRVFSLFADGRPGMIIWISAGFEMLGFLSGMYWLWGGPG
jgi:hypothetical protein